MNTITHKEWTQKFETGHQPRNLSGEKVQSWNGVKQPQDLAMVSSMLYAGLRVGEVVSLHPMDNTADSSQIADLDA